eukprot:2341377-Amphidinium_carterae.3
MQHFMPHRCAMTLSECEVLLSTMKLRDANVAFCSASTKARCQAQAWLLFNIVVVVTTQMQYGKRVKHAQLTARPPLPWHSSGRPWTVSGYFCIIAMVVTCGELGGLSVQIKESST